MDIKLCKYVVILLYEGMKSKFYPKSVLVLVKNAYSILDKIYIDFLLIIWLLKISLWGLKIEIKY